MKAVIKKITCPWSEAQNMSKFTGQEGEKKSAGQLRMGFQICKCRTKRI